MLVERIAGGDAEALGDLYDRYGRVAFGMLYRMLPGPEAAEEVRMLSMLSGGGRAPTGPSVARSAPGSSPSVGMPRLTGAARAANGRSAR